MEDGELDGEDALVEATVTVGVGEGIPCGEDVGGRKRGVAGRTSPPTTWGGLNRKMLPYCESTEAFVWGKRQELLQTLVKNFKKNGRVLANLFSS